MSSVRLVAVSLQPHLVVDDGQVLHRLPVDAVIIEASQWPNVINILQEAIAELQTQIEHQG